MSDDWRVRIECQDARASFELTELLEQAEHDLEGDFDDRVAVSRDDQEIFCYTGTRELAGRVEALVRALAAEHGWELEAELSRWHPAAEEWEDPDKPLVAGPEESGERAELIERERAEAAERGWPEFEVRVELPSHRDAIAFEQRLRAEGLPFARRWRYVLIGATDEDAAAALAERLRAETPPGSTVGVEGTLRAVENETGYRLRYAIFGGMGG